MYYVYMLRCADGTLYTGTAADAQKRLKVHNSGKGAKYTRSRLPVELVYTEELPDKSAALKREAAIKRLNRKEKLCLMEYVYSNKRGCKTKLQKANPMCLLISMITSKICSQ